MVILLALYLSGYYTISGQTEEKNVELQQDPDVEIVSKKIRHYLLQPPGSNNGNMLPGAVLLEDRKFEGSQENVESGRRDANVLPGAIGLEGKFDETTESLADLLRTSSGKSIDRTAGAALRKSSKSKSSSASKANQKGGEKKFGSTEPDSKAKTSTSTKQSLKKREVNATTPDDNSRKDTSSGQGGQSKAKSTGRKHSKSKKVPEPTSSGPLYTGPHPMNRNMSELQVPSDAALDDSTVREHYGKLVKAYLAPFVDGITRKSFFEILRRRTYSLAPPGSNKGIQTLLFQLLDKSKLGTRTISILLCEISTFKCRNTC